MSAIYRHDCRRVLSLWTLTSADRQSFKHPVTGIVHWSVIKSDGLGDLINCRLSRFRDGRQTLQWECLEEYCSALLLLICVYNKRMCCMPTVDDVHQSGSQHRRRWVSGGCERRSPLPERLGGPGCRPWETSETLNAKSCLKRRLRHYSENYCFLSDVWCVILVRSVALLKEFHT